MVARRRYDPDVRSRAVRRVLVDEVAITEVARQEAVNPSTLRDWVGRGARSGRARCRTCRKPLVERNAKYCDWECGRIGRMLPAAATELAQLIDAELAAEEISLAELGRRTGVTTLSNLRRGAVVAPSARSADRLHDYFGDRWPQSVEVDALRRQLGRDTIDRARAVLGADGLRRGGASRAGKQRPDVSARMVEFHSSKRNEDPSYLESRIAALHADPDRRLKIALGQRLRRSRGADGVIDRQTVVSSLNEWAAEVAGRQGVSPQRVRDVWRRRLADEGIRLPGRPRHTQERADRLSILREEWASAHGVKANGRLRRARQPVATPRGRTVTTPYEYFFDVLEEEGHLGAISSPVTLQEWYRQQLRQSG